MDYSGLVNAYLKNDLSWLRENMTSTECKQLPIIGANGEFEGKDDVFIKICDWMYKNGFKNKKYYNKLINKKN